MHKKVTHLSGIVLCDSKTIKTEMLLDLPGQSDTHNFPHQHPTPADLLLWRRALCKLSSEFHVLTVPLQEYVSPPHELPGWMLNNDGLILHNMITHGNQEYHKVYTPKSYPFARKTQSGQRFMFERVVMGTSNLHKYASVTPSQPGHILLQSSIPMHVQPPPVSGFEHTMKHFSNQTLWVLLDYSGDGSWILDKMILAQSLVIIYDGSYMKEVSPDIRSVAMMIYCKIAKARCKCTWAEHLSSAGAYCGELLGGLMMQLILNAAASEYHSAIPMVVVGHGL
jgi:hypothetical protein